jgi:hypothetical protein
MGMSILRAAIAVTVLSATADAQSAKWFRGNTHTHTLNSDGDSPPDSVARWYRDRGYHFLFITDHERITDPRPLNERFAVPGKFLLIAGQEVTQRVADSTHHQGLRQAHVNALGVSSVIMPNGERGIARGMTMSEAYLDNISRIHAQGAIAQVNHPNFIWSVRLHDLAQLPDSVLLEVANAHTGVNNAGDGADFTSAEGVWDWLLSRGKTVFAVADDDAHSFRPADADRFDLTRPGRGWIMVRADTLTDAAILRAIKRGDFYASTGVTLDSLDMWPVLRVRMKSVAQSRFKTEFIGNGGVVLSTQYGPSAEFRPTACGGYVRARITDSNGRMAWTQAERFPPAPHGCTRPPMRR